MRSPTPRHAVGTIALDGLRADRDSSPFTSHPERDTP